MQRYTHVDGGTRNLGFSFEVFDQNGILLIIIPWGHIAGEILAVFDPAAGISIKIFNYSKRKLPTSARRHYVLHYPI